MSSLEGLKNMILTVLPLSLIDVIDIMLLALIIYLFYKFLKETRATGLVGGIGLLLAVYGLAFFLKMKALSFIFNVFFNVGIIVIVILFQPELRRTLEKMTHYTFYTMHKFNIPLGPLKILFGNKQDNEPQDDQWENCITAISEACGELSKSSTGALIVIERHEELGEQIDGGTKLDSRASKELIGNIFYEGAPLHDGAIIIRDGLIHAAACYLPRPARDMDINKALGARHRAAIGMSENSDAIVVVVSEETGIISMAKDGVMIRRLDRQNLFRLLQEDIVPPEEEDTISRRKRGWKNG